MMILGISGTILKFMLIVALVGVMILVLTCINYSILAKSRRMADDNAHRLRNEVEHSNRVISQDSVFHDFLTETSREWRRQAHHKNHHSTVNR